MRDLTEVVPLLEKDFNDQKISGRVLCDKLALLDEMSRKSAAYVDHKYIPFYYHLGKYFDSRNVIEIGFSLGLHACAFLTSCKTVQCFLGFQQKTDNYMSFRLGKANIKKKFKGDIYTYLGNLYDDEFDKTFSSMNYDLCIINDEFPYDYHLNCLEMVWKRMNEKAIICIEYTNRHKPSQEALESFCCSVNRKPIYFNTRYGTTIIQK
jgi:hypothetical protein